MLKAKQVTKESWHGHTFQIQCRQNDEFQLVWDLCGGYPNGCGIGIVVVVVVMVVVVVVVVVVAVVAVVVSGGGGGGGGGAGVGAAAVADRADAAAAEIYCNLSEMYCMGCRLRKACFTLMFCSYHPVEALIIAKNNQN